MRTTLVFVFSVLILGLPVPALAEAREDVSPGSTALASSQESLWSEAEAAGCIPDDLTLCLGDHGRFGVRVSWSHTRSGPEVTGNGHAVPLNGGSGTFWFFDPNNTELLVKVIRACGLGGRYWVFTAAMTNVAYLVQVVDFDQPEVAGRIYINQEGHLARPVADTTGFPCLPSELQLPN